MIWGVSFFHLDWRRAATTPSNVRVPSAVACLPKIRWTMVLGSLLTKYLYVVFQFFRARPSLPLLVWVTSYRPLSKSMLHRARSSGDSMGHLASEMNRVMMLRSRFRAADFKWLKSGWLGSCELPNRDHRR